MIGIGSVGCTNNVILPRYSSPCLGNNKLFVIGISTHFTLIRIKGGCGRSVVNAKIYDFCEQIKQ